jgi:hypothetical protein
MKGTPSLRYAKVTVGERNIQGFFIFEQGEDVLSEGMEEYEISDCHGRSD